MLAKVTGVELSVPAWSTPRAVLAVATVVAPVPPLAIGTVPPVISWPVIVK